MPLRIGVDLDGVLADMDGELVRQAGLIFGRSMPRRIGHAATSVAPQPVSPDSDASASSDCDASASPDCDASASSDSDAPASSDSDAPASSDSDAPASSDSDAVASGDSVGSEPSLPVLHLTTRQRRRLWHHVSAIDNFWETLEEIELGSIARLAALATDRRWETI